VISFSKVSKQYGKQILFVDASFQLNSGEKVGLVGPNGSHHAMLEANFAKPVTFDHSVLMEWLNDGQHVERFRIEAWTGTGWKPVVEGDAIGHKRIDHFTAVTASRIRLNILSSTADAHIREFQIYNVGNDAGRP
jgi:alpha-L-fucosidase